MKVTKEYLRQIISEEIEKINQKDSIKDVFGFSTPIRDNLAIISSIESFRDFVENNDIFKKATENDIQRAYDAVKEHRYTIAFNILTGQHSK